LLLIDPLFLTVSISSTGSSLDKSIETESTGKTNINIDNTKEDKSIENKVISTSQIQNKVFKIYLYTLYNVLYNFFSNVCYK